MKLIPTVAVAASTILLLVLPTELQGAPQITSEELGKAVQQLEELLKSEAANAKSAYGPREFNSKAQWYGGPYAKSAYGPRELNSKAQWYGGPYAKSAYGPRELNSKAQWYGGPYAKSAHHPRELNAKAQHTRKESEATAQVRGVNILNCGTAGDIVNAALQPLNTLFSNDFGVLVDCQISPGCIQVRVDVPADDLITDVDVCDRGKSP